MTSSFYWSYSWALHREIDWLTNRSIGKERSCNRASISFPAVIVQPWLERSGCVPGSVERYSLGMDAGYLLLHHAIIFPVVHQQKETGKPRNVHDWKIWAWWEEEWTGAIIFPIQKVGGCYVFLFFYSVDQLFEAENMMVVLRFSSNCCDHFLFLLFWSGNQLEENEGRVTVAYPLDLLLIALLLFLFLFPVERYQ